MATPLPVQTTYSLQLTAALEGNIGNFSIPDLTVKAAETIIGFGRAVGRGATSDQSCQIIGASGAASEFVGVSIFNFAVENPLYAQTTQYNIGDKVSILRTGYVYVWSEVAVTAGNPVYYRVTAAAFPNDVVGRWSNAAGTGLVLLSGATFEKTTSAAGVTLIRIVH